MSTRLAQLVAQLRRFDDDALVALANKGLLRRAQKDLEKNPPVTVEETADRVTVSLGEIRVSFDARGPAHAQCSCPAASVCQHILAAVIFLQQSTATPAEVPPNTPPTPDSGSPVTDPELAALQAELLRMTPSDLAQR